MSPTSPRPFIWALCAPPPCLVPQENKQDPDKDQSLYLSALQFFTESATVFPDWPLPRAGPDFHSDQGFSPVAKRTGDCKILKTPSLSGRLLQLLQLLRRRLTKSLVLPGVKIKGSVTVFTLYPKCRRPCSSM